MVYLPIRSYDNYVTANLELSLLRDAGITCHIKDEYTVTIDPLLSPALGGMKLMVQETDLEKALGLLNSRDKLYLASIACPACGRHSLEKITEILRFDSWIGKIRSLLVNGQEETMLSFYRCNSCSHRFNELPNQ